MMILLKIVFVVMLLSFFAYCYVIGKRYFLEQLEKETNETNLAKIKELIMKKEGL